MMPAPARCFALRVLAFFSPLLVVIALVEGALWKTGETQPIAAIVARRQNAPVLWLRGDFDQGIYAYKAAGFKKLRPRIVALGSSRVMKFRAGMFGQGGKVFFNCGGLMRSIAELEVFVDGLDAGNAPAVLILGIDELTLNGNNRDEVRSSEDDVYNWRAHVVEWRELARKPQHRRSAFKSLVAALRAPVSENALGIQARTTGDGFRSDGSKLNNRPSPHSLKDWNFADHSRLQNIREGREAFEFGDHLSQARMRRLHAALLKLQNKGVLVLAFAPPHVSAAVRLLETTPGQKTMWREYLREVPRLCAQLRIPFCDASSPQKLGLQDFAMSDAVHAEETLHLYILRAWLQDARVRKALPDAARAVEAALKSPRTDAWKADVIDPR